MKEVLLSGPEHWGASHQAWGMDSTPGCAWEPALCALGSILGVVPWSHQVWGTPGRGAAGTVHCHHCWVSSSFDNSISFLNRFVFVLWVRLRTHDPVHFWGGVQQ